MKIAVQCNWMTQEGGDTGAQVWPRNVLVIIILKLQGEYFLSS